MDNKKVLCLLTCVSADPNNYNGQSVQLNAQYTGSPEDNTFAAATPYAQLIMTVDNPFVTGIQVAGSTEPAGDKFFEPGQRYRVTIEKDFGPEATTPAKDSFDEQVKDTTEKVKEKIMPEAKTGKADPATGK